MKWRFRRRENLEPRTRSKAQEVEEIEEIEDRDEEEWWWEGGLTNPAQRLQSTRVDSEYHCDLEALDSGFGLATCHLLTQQTIDRQEDTS